MRGSVHPHVGRSNRRVAPNRGRVLSMRHAVLGAGGVGGLIGAYLAECGFSVTVILRREAVQTFPERLQLESPIGNFRVPVDRAATVPGVDVLWVAVKATQLDSALQLVGTPSDVPTIVPLLNGVDHIALLQSRYGPDRVVAATLAVEAERVAPGHVVQRSPFVRLRISSTGCERLEEPVRRLQELGVTCQFVDDDRTLMWSKLVFLAPLALATTARSQTKGELHSDRHAWQEVQDCVWEACRVAQAEGATVDAEQVISSLDSLPEGMQTSMQRDVAAGRTPELDAIGGAVLRGAIRHGIAVPVTRSLVTRVERRLTGPR